MLNLDSRRLETAVTELPVAPPGLSPELVRRYRSERARIGRRYREWRANMPALGTLFDDDAHQAKALAGNLATELDAALRVGVGIAREVSGRRRGELAAWVDESDRQWRGAVRRSLDQEGWDSGPRQVFDGFLDELAERARRAGLAALQAPAAGSEPGPIVATLRRVLEAAARPLARLFRPESGV